MDIRLLTSANDLALYDRWVKNHPQGSLWQSVEWKKYQEALGRRTRLYAAFNNGDIITTALVVIDTTTGGLSTWDCPRGPVGSSDELLARIMEDSKKTRCLSLYLSPITKLATCNLQLATSDRHQQPEATRILDLTMNDDRLLAQMHPKGRYNIKVAQKHGIVIEQSNDISAYVALAKKTSERDGFEIPSKHQLQTFLISLPGSFLLLAKLPSPLAGEGAPEGRERGEAVAGLIGTVFNGTGIYYYGASDHQYRNLMAPYLLQWEAMKYCKEQGCKQYDLLGIAPPDATDDHHWAGISSFKEKFGGIVVTYPPEQQIVLRPVAQRLLQLKRKLVG